MPPATAPRPSDDAGPAAPARAPRLPFGLPPLARWALAWLAGLALGLRAAAPPSPAVATTAVALAGGAWLLARRWPGPGASRQRAREAAALALCLVLGALRGAASVPVLDRDHVARWIDAGPVVVHGTIARPPDRRDRRTDYLVAVEAVRSAEREADGTSASGDAVGRVGLIRHGGPVVRGKPDAHPDPWFPAHGLILAQAARFPPRGVGDRIVLTGTLELAPDGPGFDYRAYLADHGIHALMQRPAMATRPGGRAHPVRRALEAVRERGRVALGSALPEPAASLAVGILLGDDRGIPRPLDDAFQVTGTTHVIAISGSNIALLVAVLAASLGRVLGRRRAAPATIAAVGLYAVLVGADPAVVRAAIMGGVLVLGDVLGRPTHAPTALLAAAWAMTAWRPAVLHDLGFQLSFAATAGLVAYARPLTTTVDGLLAAHGLARGRTALRALQEPLLVTCAAQATTWPIVALHTGRLSIVSLVANLLIVPVQPLVMALGGLTAVAGAAWEPAGRGFGALAWLPLAWTIGVVERAAAVPHADVGLPLSAGAVCAYYGGLLAIAAGRGRLRGALASAREALAGPRSRRSLPRTRVAGPAAVAARHASGWPATLAAIGLAALVWSGLRHRPDGLLHFHALDVGQGDALLVVTPTGRRMLVDGGPSPSAVLAELGRRLPPWDRRLDVVVLTHPDADHVGGLAAVLRRYRVAWVLDPGAEHPTAEAAEYEAAVAAEVAAGATRVRATAGLRLVLDDAAGVEAVALWPPDEPPGDEASVNDRSVVLRLVHGRTAFLLTGDIEAGVEERLVADGVPLAADVLKVAHHGSDTSSTPAFVAAVRPALAVISAGAGNAFGHPTAGTLERLAAAAIRRTDREGAVEVIGDGAGLWVR